MLNKFYTGLKRIELCLKWTNFELSVFLFLFGIASFCCFGYPVFCDVMAMRYSRGQLYALRRSPIVHSCISIDDIAVHGLLRYRGSRAGRCVRERRILRQRASIDWESHMTSNYDTTNHIDVVIGRRTSVDKHQQIRPRQIRSIPSATKEPISLPDVNTPTMYVFNAASIAKPHAIESLTAELTGYQIDVAIITETHLKPSKHPDGCFDISGYSLIRRDRVGRRGGGVAIYARSSMKPTVWKSRDDDPKFEILWVRLSNNCFIGALYHPPTPTGYTPVEMLNYVESAVEELAVANPDALIILAGDFNQLSDQEVIERTGLTSLVTEPTRGESKLDRIYISSLCYQNVKIVNSVAKSDHKAIIAYSGPPIIAIKTKSYSVYRKKSPSQNARFMEFLQTVDFETHSDPEKHDVQMQFDHFYETTLGLLNQFYPERRVLLTSNDPEYITPEIKDDLRRKNKLMRAGRLEEAGALSRRIGTKIIHRNSARLNTLNHKVDTRELWEKIRTGAAGT